MSLAVPSALRVLPPLPSLGLASAIERWQLHLSDQRRLGLTKIGYAFDARQLVAHLAAKLGRDPVVQDLTTQAIQGWLRQLRGRTGGEAAPATVIRKAQSARSLCAYLCRAKEIKEDPCQDLVLPAAPVRLPRPLPRLRVLEMLAEPAGRCDWRGRRLALRNTAILYLLYCALRCCEVARLNIEDLSFDEPKRGQVTLWVLGKGNRAGQVVCVAEVAKVLLRYLDRVPQKKGPLFRSFRDGKRITRMAVGKLAKGAGLRIALEGATAHRLRHSCATHLADRGCTEAAIQGYLRHSSAASTKVYMQISTAQQERRAARFHPLQKGVPDLWRRGAAPDRRERMRRRG